MRGALMGRAAALPRAPSEARPSHPRVRSPRAPSRVRVGQTAGAGGCLWGDAARTLPGALEMCLSRTHRFFWLRALPPTCIGRSQYFQVFTESDFHCLMDGAGDELYVKHALSSGDMKGTPPTLGMERLLPLLICLPHTALPGPAGLLRGCEVGSACCQDHLVLLCQASSLGVHKGLRVPPLPADLASVGPPPTPVRGNTST